MNQIKSEILQVLIITKNESPNIKRVLDKLTWVERVIVLDSYSTDSTVQMAEAYPNVEVHFRVYDTVANQCNYGLSLLNSEWVISIDADYVLTDGFIEETKKIVLQDTKNSAYIARLHFLVFGIQLISNNTSPRPVLFRRTKCQYFDDGHTHRLEIDGSSGFIKSYILHDDRKPLTTWVQMQNSYSIRECDKLLMPLNPNNSSFSAKVRRTKIFAPFIVFFYCLFVKGLIFNGWAGWHYTLQRTMVEILFALRLIEKEKLSKHLE